MLSNDEVYMMIRSISTFDRYSILKKLYNQEMISREQYHLLMSHRRSFRDGLL